MKLLVMTNAYPSEQKPYAGIFVKNQYEYLKASSAISSVDIFYLERTFTGTGGSVKKYLGSLVQFVPYLFKKFDVIHLHFFFPMVLFLIFYKLFHPRTKIVTTLHGSDIHDRFKNKVVNAVFKQIAKLVSFYQAVGQDLRDEAEERLDVTVDEVVSAGVDDRIFYPDRKELEYDFAFVGSFIDRKGVDLMVEAIRQINDESLRFCFVGSGPFTDDIKSLSEVSQVTCYENLTQREIAEILNKSRYFIFPTRYEPFGLVVTEALYCGTPAIVSRNGGMKEQVVDWDNGFFIDDTTTECVVDAISTAMSLEQEKYQGLCRNAAASNKPYSLSHICEHNIKTYQAIVK